MEIKRNMHVCDRCGEETDDPMHVTSALGGVRIWCPDCVEAYATTCDRCGELIDARYQYPVTVVNSWNSQHEETWCWDCATSHAVQCDECGEWYADSRGVEISTYGTWSGDEITLCENCRDNYYICDDCGQLIHPDDATYCESDDCTYCPDCYERHDGEDLHAYHHTGGELFWTADGEAVPVWRLSDDLGSRLYMGIELETDDNDDAVSLARDITSAYDSDYVECKHDGSLYHNGVEIVSQPMEAGYHLTSGMWEDIAQIVRAHGGSSHEAGTCGLHIHLSRRALNGDGAVYRLDRMFHRFAAQMINFSRRTSGQMTWCEIDDDTDLNFITDAGKRRDTWKSKKRWSGRYVAINDTNANTVEIRLWRGTLNMETFRATVEFTYALASVANASTDEMIEAVTWSQLKTLCKVALENAGLPHDDMRAYMRRRGL